MHLPWTFIIGTRRNDYSGFQLYKFLNFILCNYRYYYIYFVIGIPFYVFGFNLIFEQYFMGKLYRFRLLIKN